MANVWPPSLPPRQFEGMKDTNRYAILRSDPEVGPAKVRRRSTRIVKEFSTPIEINGEQRKVFDTFYGTTLNGGVESFQWEDPVDDTTIVCRFMEEPSWSLKIGGSDDNRIWKATLKLEVIGNA